MPLPSNTPLGRYQIRSLLGEGGMGEVYLAEDTTLRRPVAVKLLPAEFTADTDRLHRFEREAFAASSLNHPNILTIHEIGVEDGHHFIATEFIDGESLRQHLKDKRLALREVLEIGGQVASALSAAHAARIVHRDIKPENIMVRKDGIVKVLDFGLAKLGEQEQKGALDAEAPTRVSHHTAPGVLMGTVSYMSPEQARGKEVDERTDIWSLGVVLYEMIAGRLPFEGETIPDVLGLILHKEPPPLTHAGTPVPAELDRIVTKALRKDKEERYQVVKDLGLDLKSLKQRLEFEAERERTDAPERSSQTRGAATTRGAVPGRSEHRRSRHRRPGRRRASAFTRLRARNTSSRKSSGTSAARRSCWRRSWRQSPVSLTSTSCGAGRRQSIRWRSCRSSTSAKTRTRNTSPTASARV
jgi:serine/threonine protein kinase